ncbi:MAG: hypothetical protein ACM3ML_21830 [Micromonosporaceae bacterium]
MSDVTVTGESQLKEAMCGGPTQAGEQLSVTMRLVSDPSLRAAGMWGIGEAALTWQPPLIRWSICC